MDNGADTLWVRVSLEAYFSDERARCLIAAGRGRRAGWLARRLRRTFALARRPALLLERHLLPPAEPLPTPPQGRPLELRAVPPSGRVVDVTRRSADRPVNCDLAPADELPCYGSAPADVPLHCELELADKDELPHCYLQLTDKDELPHRVLVPADEPPHCELELADKDELPHRVPTPVAESAQDRCRETPPESDSCWRSDVDIESSEATRLEDMKRRALALLDGRGRRRRRVRRRRAAPALVLPEEVPLEKALPPTEVLRNGNSPRPPRCVRALSPPAPLTPLAAPLPALTEDPISMDC